MTTNNALSEIFDVQQVPMIKLPTHELTTIPEETALKDDANLVRANLKDLMATSNTALVNALNVAIQSESPKAFESLSMLINTAADLNDRLMNTHSTQRRIESYSKPDINATQNNDNKTVNNVIFSGTPGELAKLLRGDNTDSQGK